MPQSYAAKALDSLPVGVVEAAQPHAFDVLVTSPAGVAVAVVSENEASGAASDDGEATDAALRDEETSVSADGRQNLLSLSPVSDQ